MRSFGLVDITGNTSGASRVIVYGADGKVKFSGGAGVTSVTATAPITSTGGATPDISTSMNTNKLIGRSTAGVGVMEEITIGTGLSLAAGTLTNTDTGSAVTLTSAGGTETLVNDGTGPSLATKGLTAGTGISLTGAATDVTITNSGVTAVNATSPITSTGGSTPTISTSIATSRLVGRTTAGTGVMEQIVVGSGLTLSGGSLTNSDPGSSVSLASAGIAVGTQTLVNDGVGPALATKGIVAGSGIGLSSNATDITITNSSPATGVTLTSAGGTETLVNDGIGPALANKGLTAGTGISLSSTATAVTITNSDPASGVTLTSAGGTETLVNDGTGPSLATKGLTAGAGVTLTSTATAVTIAASGVTSVSATAPITSTGGTTPTISTSMNTNRLIGRTTAGVGVMEEIQVSTGLTLSAGALSIDYGVISVSTTNAREDNYTPAGWPGTNDVVKVIRITPNNTNNIVSIGGLTNGTAGRIVHITNDATDQLLIIDHESTTSTATNRFKFKLQMSYFLLPGRDITFIYDGSRWTELGQYNWAGLDLVDHMNSPQNGTTSTETNTTHYSFLRVGTGALARSAIGLSNYDLAGTQMNTGSTATGSVLGGLGLRNAGGTFALNANGLFPFLLLNKVSSLTAPTALQDYVANVALESSSATFAGNGYIWKQPSFATTYAGVWEIDVVNTAGTLAANVVTGVSTSVDQYLGIFNHGNNGNATFFSSTDGLTYTATYKFTRVTGTFAGWPKIRLASTVGTTAKNWTVYMAGISQNYKR